MAGQDQPQAAAQDRTSLSGKNAFLGSPCAWNFLSLAPAIAQTGLPVSGASREELRSCCPTRTTSQLSRLKINSSFHSQKTTEDRYLVRKGLAGAGLSIRGHGLPEQKRISGNHLRSLFQGRET